MIKVGEKQAARLSSSIRQMWTEEDTASVEIEQYANRRRPTVIIVTAYNRSGKIHRIDRINPAGARTVQRYDAR